MPGLSGRDPREAFERFRDHLAGLLNRTITDARLSLLHVRKDDSAQVTFRNGITPVAAHVASDLFLYVGQTLRVAQQSDKSWKLRTTSYRYRIQGTPGLEDEDCLRWEYVSREMRDTKHCRHHLHLQGEYTLGPRRIVPLTQVHIPTGWVTLEEIIRFLITELDVSPREQDWERELRESEELFKQWTSRDI